MIAEPARGGWKRYLAWTVSLLPLPRDWAHSRVALARVAERALLGDIPGDDELIRLGCEAYGVAVLDVAPLLRWQIAATRTPASN